MALYRMVDGVRVDLTPEEEAKLLAEWKAIEEETKKTIHIEQRKSEYPNFKDTIEALVDALDNISKSGINIGNSANELVNQIKNIHTKYPKPS